MKKIKISVKSLLQKFNGCDTEYIKNICHASCCRSSTSTNGTLITIHPTEEKNIIELGGVVKNGLLQPRLNEKKCPFQNESTHLCDIHFTGKKPFGCIASPFTLNSNDTLIVRNRYRLLKCFDKKNSTNKCLPAYKVFRQSLVLILGEEKTNLIEKSIEIGKVDLNIMIDNEVYNKLKENDVIKHENNGEQSGTSIFDPVLCEISYRWFMPKEGGTILDPFAGGSVRGIVAGMLGYKYIGIDLREEQIEANRIQWENIDKSGKHIFLISDSVDNKPDFTDIEEKDGYFFKRDDLFSIAGVKGGKVRSCWALSQNAKGLVTAGSRASPQVNIVAHIAKKLNIPCRVHTPEGELSPEVQMAKDCGAEVIQHKAGYNNVIIARAREDAKEQGFINIPFGMECSEAIKQTKQQIQNIPFDKIKRIVVPVGSGMSLAGILNGLFENNISIPVLGVCVGADPIKRLNEYAPKQWRDMCTLQKSEYDYHQPYLNNEFCGIKLDPHYEAKCIPFVEKGDLLWIVGIRKTSDIQKIDAIPPIWHTENSLNIDTICKEPVDFIFSCPPYFDLEVYSDNPQDLSTLEWDEFLSQYRTIIKKSIDLLKEDRFACFVVGDIRDKKGFYRNFVGETIKAFEDAGAKYYNEGILITSVGSLPIRINKQFQSGRKLGKTHQNYLVFFKGDPRKIKNIFGELDLSDNSDDFM